MANGPSDDDAATPQAAATPGTVIDPDDPLAAWRAFFRSPKIS